MLGALEKGGFQPPSVNLESQSEGYAAKTLPKPITLLFCHRQRQCFAGLRVINTNSHSKHDQNAHSQQRDAACRGTSPPRG